jgi:hypothetical protein
LAESLENFDFMGISEHNHDAAHMEEKQLILGAKNGKTGYRL